MKYAVDIDGVLAEAISPVLDRLNREWGSHYGKEDVTAWNFWNLFSELAALPRSKQRDKVLRTMEAVWEAGEVKPDSNASTMMHRLRQDGHRVDVVTKTLAKTETLRRLLAENDIPYDNLVHFPKGMRDSKATLDYDVFIDDNPSLATEIPSQRLMVLRDQPWNRDVPERENVKRIKNLMEAILPRSSPFGHRHAPRGAREGIRTVEVRRHLRRVRLK